MPKASKKPALAPHSSEVDELADDAPLQPSPPRRGRLAPGPSKGWTAARPPSSKSTKPSVSRKTSAGKASASSKTASSTNLDRFRYAGPSLPNTTRLDENIASDRMSTSGASPVKRPHPTEESRSGPSTNAVSGSKRPRTAPPAAPPLVKPRPDKGKKKAVEEDEAVFFLPELDEDGEPIFPDSPDPPAAPRAAAAGPSPARSHFHPAPHASLVDAQHSPFRPAGTRTHSARPSPARASRPASSSAPTARSTPARRPPSSIDLPDALAARVYARASPSPSPAPSAHGPSASATLGIVGRSSSPFVPLALAAGGEGKRAGSQRLTSVQREEVDALCAGLEMDFEEDERDEDALETCGETITQVEEDKAANLRASEVQPAQLEKMGEVDVDDPDKTLVDVAPNPIEKDAPAPSPSASNASSRVFDDPFANDVPIGPPRPTPPASFLRSPTPPLPLQFPAPAPHVPSPAPAAPSVIPNRFYRATTPPPRPPGYRLVPLTASGLAEHARAVADAAATSANTGETAFLRGEVARLVGELGARDLLLGDREAAAREASGRVERWEERGREWGEERRAWEARVDVLREVRRGLLGQLEEERARVSELEARLAALEGATGVAEHIERAATGDGSPLALEEGGLVSPCPEQGLEAAEVEVDQLDDESEMPLDPPAPAPGEEAVQVFEEEAWINCVTSGGQLPNKPRSGPRIEAAKAHCGTAPSSLVLSATSTQQSLVDDTLAGGVGYELLKLYAEAGGGSGMPLFPPPMLDYIGLMGRFEAAGRQLPALTPDDQLLCRIVFAAAAPHWASKAAPASSMPQQLLEAAQSSADRLAIWRKPTSTHATALVLLQQAAGRGHIVSQDAFAYLSSALAHIHVHKVCDPAAAGGTRGEGAPSLVWVATVFDACAAVELGTPPVLSDGYYAEFFRRGNKVKLTSRTMLEKVMRIDPWSTTIFLLHHLLVAVTLLRRVAYLLDQSRDIEQGQQRCGDFEGVRKSMDNVYAWGAMALDVARTAEDPFLRTIIGMYTHIAYGSTVFAELAVFKLFQRIVENDAVNSSPASPEGVAALGVDERYARLQQSACAYLRAARLEAPATNFLAVFTGSLWSTSRLCELANAVLATSAWQEQLHPDGPRDKLASLTYLHAALYALHSAYPETPTLAETLEAVAQEKRTLDVLLGPASLSLAAPLNPRSPPTSVPAASPSLARINSWTHLNDAHEVLWVDPHADQAAGAPEPPAVGVTELTPSPPPRTSTSNTPPFVAAPTPSGPPAASVPEDAFAPPSASSHFAFDTDFALLDLLAATFDPAAGVSLPDPDVTTTADPLGAFMPFPSANSSFAVDPTFLPSASDAHPSDLPPQDVWPPDWAQLAASMDGALPDTLVRDASGIDWPSPFPPS
ncbi:hypothetical protein JCM10450v2_004257 [Rhodotorula kratochvilovae]